MKITIVLGPFQPLPPAGFGAVEKIWVEIARGFAGKGHEVCVIGRSGSGQRDYVEPSGVRVLANSGYDATGRIAVDLFKDLLYGFRVIPTIPRSDIVVTNSFWLPVLLSPLKRLKGRIVVHVARYPKGQMWLYLGADAIQTVSGPVARAVVQQCRALGRKVFVVGNPIDTNIYCPPARGRRMSPQPTVLYLGRVHPEKGLQLLVDAFRRIVARVPAARLKIVGPVEKRHGGGGSDYLESLKSAANGLPVEFAQAISGDMALSRTYQEADCFCYPSLAEKGEAFGLAVLEAMATGLPCVVSKLECFADFLKHDADGVVFDHRSKAPQEALADAICSILLDPGKADSLGASARRAAERFSVGHITDAYVTLFSSLLSPPRDANRGLL